MTWVELLLTSVGEEIYLGLKSNQLINQEEQSFWLTRMFKLEHCYFVKIFLLIWLFGLHFVINLSYKKVYILQSNSLGHVLCLVGNSIQTTPV